MPTRPHNPCSTPGCVSRAPTGGRCETCRSRRRTIMDAQRGTSTERGYDAAWRATRLDYLTRHPWCRLCGHVATVADHHPTSRRDLVTAGVPDPDTDHRLRPLCDRCHRTETARNQPGGWNRYPRNT